MYLVFEKSVPEWYTIFISTVEFVTPGSSQKAGTVAFTIAKNIKSVTVPATVKIGGRTFQVTEIKGGAFKGSKAVNKTFIKKYKKFFTKANAGKKVTVK